MSPEPPAAFPGALPPGTEIDHFRVMRSLGEGGMAEVYLARDTRLGRRVALKVVKAEALGSPQDVERFAFEARATARFSHAHIVTIHHVGETEGRPYVALEYLQGETLAERLQTERPGAAGAIRIGLAIAEALTEAHAKGLLHRDLKPANVMLCRDGRIRVLDFGLARALSDAAEDLGDLEASQLDNPFVSEHRGVRGTPAYMAPEQWREQPITEAIDVWALGVVMHEMALGCRPYDASSRLDLGLQVTAPEPVALAEDDHLAPELSLLITDCLHKDAGHRPPAHDVARRLRRLLASDPAADRGEHSPFRGLLPFDERHHHVFFGRDGEIAEFVERLRSQPVLSVVGPSGAGKSSFVQAGVIPRLRERGPLVVLQLRPGHAPFQALAARIAEARQAVAGGLRATAFGSPAGEDGDTRDDVLAGQLESSPHVLNLVLHRLAEQRRASVLLFVDQLEELITLGADADGRAAFVQALCAAADDPELPVRVVLTLREEFLGRIADSPQGREALSHIAVLQRPGPTALQEILARPVEAVGYRYDEPALVGRMVDEVRGETSCLPLLQFTGQMLWERRDREGRSLTAATYEEVGGVGGALARHADGILSGLSPDEVGLARTMLLRLVTPEGTRRALPASRVLEGLEPDAADDVLERLIDGRLLAVRRSAEDDAGELELVHESLVDAWTRLARWLEEGREELVFLGEVSQAAELWERRGCRDDEVWQGDALREARRAAGNCTSELSEQVQRFLAAGAAREVRVQRRQGWSVAVVVGLLAGLALVMIWWYRDAEQQVVLAEFSRDQAVGAEREARAALGAQLATRAVECGDRDRAVVLAAAALLQGEEARARGVLAGEVPRWEGVGSEVLGATELVMAGPGGAGAGGGWGWAAWCGVRGLWCWPGRGVCSAWSRAGMNGWWPRQRPTARCRCGTRTGRCSWRRWCSRDRAGRWGSPETGATWSR